MGDEIIVMYEEGKSTMQDKKEMTNNVSLLPNNHGDKNGRIYGLDMFS